MGSSHFIITIAGVIDIVLDVYIWIIIARALTSWTNFIPYDKVVIFPHRNNTKQKVKRILILIYNKLIIFLYRLTEPVLQPIRKIIPRHSLPIDFAPLVVLLIIIFLQYFLVQTMIQMASGL